MKYSRVKCNKCNAIVEHNRRQISGCLCDPDAPTWVYIELDGSVKGFSQSDWSPLPEDTDEKTVQ